MKNRIRMLIALFIFQTLISCCKDVKFLDYSVISVLESTTFVDTESSLGLTIKAEDVEFVAALQSFGHHPAMAYNCDYGWGGMKYPIMRIDILSASDFDSLHPAGTSLSDLFEYEEFVGEDEFESSNLSEIDNYSAETINLTLSERPSIENSHAFTILLTKSNGDVLETTTSEIVWQE